MHRPDLFDYCPFLVKVEAKDQAIDRVLAKRAS
jgi:hypothetical protein